MDKKTLKQYRALIHEQELNDRAIDKLYDRLANVPVVAGKVVGSSCDFPYTEVRTTVQMDGPVDQKKSTEGSRSERIGRKRSGRRCWK